MSAPMKWGSLELWNALRPEIKYITFDELGVYGYIAKPELVTKTVANRTLTYWYSDPLRYHLTCVNIDFLNLAQPTLLERPIPWEQPSEDTPVDTKVWASYDGVTWKCGHYAALGEIFTGGGTSWTTGITIKYPHIILAQGNRLPDSMKDRLPLEVQTRG